MRTGTKCFFCNIASLVAINKQEGLLCNYSSPSYFIVSILLQEFGEFFLDGFATEVAGNDGAFLVYQYGGGDGIDTIELGTFACPAFEVGHLWPGHAPCLDGFFPCGFVFVQGYADNAEAFLAVGFICCNDIGHLALARTAPACPEVNQGVFVLADVVGEFHFLAFWIVHGEVDVLLADSGLLGQFDMLDDTSDVFHFTIVSRNLVDKGYLLVELKIADNLWQQINADRIADVVFYNLVHSVKGFFVLGFNLVCNGFALFFGQG